MVYGVPSYLMYPLATGIILNVNYITQTIATFDSLLSFLYQHVRATQVMSDQVAQWSDKVQIVIKKLFLSLVIVHTVIIARSIVQSHVETLDLTLDLKQVLYR